MFKDIVDCKKITLYKLSKESGISYTAINELYRGERSVESCSGKTLFSLAKTFNMTIDELYKISLERAALPSKFYSLFWDVDVCKLDLEKDKIYIISRILNYGGAEEYRFLKQAYTYEDFKEAGKRSRQLSAKSANFLRITYNLKKSEMSYYVRNIEWRNLCS